MRYPHGRIALVTGASSGIGEAAARLLAKNGYTVYCASRRGAIPAHAQGTLHALVMDVTDEASVRAGVNRIEQEQGGLDVLVHSAGDGLGGPLEVATPEDAQRQFSVSYYGAMRFVNALLPGMRERGRGILVFIGSVGGSFAVPFQALYSCSKAALAIYTEGLRLELKPFGVHACVVEPGDVKTGFTDARAKCEDCPEPYRADMERAIARMERDEKNGMAPESVAKRVLKVIERRRPPAHAVVGGIYRLFVFLKRLLPYAAVEKLLYWMYVK